MINFQEIKTELKKQGTTAARYFTRETLQTYINDRQTAKRELTQALTIRKRGMVREYMTRHFIDRTAAGTAFFWK